MYKYFLCSLYSTVIVPYSDELLCVFDVFLDQKLLSIIVSISADYYALYAITIVEIRRP